jgi:hypothetical protein
VVNYLSLMESGAMQKGNHIMIASHGMGALAGASLLQC